jgi:sulfide:quinone oxidoreductase
VKKNVLILGAGFAGLELATRLSGLADRVNVTLIDQSDAFSWFGGAASKGEAA